MNKMGSFQQKLDHLFTDTKINHKDLFAEFEAEETLQGKINVVWKLDCFHENFSIKPIKTSKDENSGKGSLAIAMKCVEELRYREALRHFNMSIIYSHPSKCGASEPNTISRAYFSRADLLSKLGKPDKCLLDIKKAASHGYPMHNEDVYALKITCPPTQQPQPGGVDNCGLMLRCCKDEVLFRNRSAYELSLGQMYSYLFSQDNIELPKLESVNEKVPALSSKVEIIFSEEKGRYITASENIYPGEVLLVEKAFSSDVSKNYQHTHCIVCLTATLTPIPCTDCTSVVYCSDGCLKSLKNSHRMECDFYLVLKQDRFLDQYAVMMKVCTQIPFSTLKYKLNKLRHDGADYQILGFKDGVYDTEEYGTIYHLAMNLDKRETYNQFCFTALALTYMKLIISTEKYVKVSIEQGKELPEDALLLAEALLRHSFIGGINASEKEELFLANNVVYSGKREVGMCIYSTFSLMNHSCDPNVMRLNYGETLVCRASQFIPKGTEVTVSYGEPFYTNGPAFRRRFLDEYHFCCSCIACNEDWPTEDRLSKDFTLKCDDCDTVLDMNYGCKKCSKKIFMIPSRVSVADQPNSADIYKLKDVIGEAACQYKVCFRQMTDVFSFSRHTTDMLAKIITLFNIFTVRPNHISIHCQKLLTQLYSRTAHHSHHHLDRD